MGEKAYSDTLLPQCTAQKLLMGATRRRNPDHDAKADLPDLRLKAVQLTK